jgi:fimbrial chaperone protein
MAQLLQSRGSYDPILHLREFMQVFKAHYNAMNSIILSRLCSTTAIALAVATATLATAVPADAMTVSPVILDLKTGGSDMSAVVSVENTFSTPLPVELTTTTAAFDDKGIKDTAAPSDDLLVFPPTALIQPGRTQAFRVQWVGDPAISQSKHYFVTVAQLPVKLPATDDTTIQLLYNFQVVVNVGPIGAKPHLVIQKTEIIKGLDGKFNPILYVGNDSSTYGYLSHGHLKIVETSPEGKQVFSRLYIPSDILHDIGPGLVASSQVRRLVVPLSLPDGEGKLDVTFTPEGN